MASTFTQAQLRALEWLPSDGSWRDKPGRLTSALSSLYLRSAGSRGGKLCECEWGNFGVRGGEGHRWRLTNAGIAAKRNRLQAAE